MKHFITPLLLVAILAISPMQLFSQNNQDTISLKDGRTLEGLIVERQVDQLKLKLENGIVAEIPFNEIASLSRIGKNGLEILTESLSEKNMRYDANMKSSGTGSLLAILLPGGGHFYAGNADLGIVYAGVEVLLAAMIAGGIDKIKHTYIVSHGGRSGWWPFITDTPYYTTIEYGYEYKYKTSYYVGIIGMIALKIWEIIDTRTHVEKYNSELHDNIFQKLSENNIKIDITRGFSNSYNLGVQIGL